MRISIFLLFILTISCISQNSEPVPSITSPDKSILLEFSLGDNGKPLYQIKMDEKNLVDRSALGFILKDGEPLDDNFEIVSIEVKKDSITWETVWGENKNILNQYQELAVTIREKEDLKRMIALRFRAFDDGIAFRYEFPEQPGLTDLEIMDELTEFNFTEDLTAWWIPADYDSYEYVYTQSNVSEIDAAKYDNVVLEKRSVVERNAAHTPLTLKTPDNLYLSIHEANLHNYPGMTLRVKDTFNLVSSLVPGREGIKASVQSPFSTPWRTIQISDTPGGLIESSMILNLNEPSAYEDVSWIKPIKYIGVWWAMQQWRYTWHSGPRHGATTENVKKHIDFAADHGFDAVLVEGWNVGWASDEAFSYTEPYPDFDMDYLSKYAEERGVRLMGHHETYSDVVNYEEQMEAGMDYYQKYGVNSIKTGYVGAIRPEGEYHHGQWMVNHHQRVVEEAAKRQIMINVHEPIKDTGLRRTYPNLVSREGVRGSEFNSHWGGGNPPEHLTIVPFTRGLAGPIDYTPGLVQLDLNHYKEGYIIPSTISYQLAAFVIVYSPIQMASDEIENYEKRPDALQFIKDVPVDWQESMVLNGEIGEYITIVRKDRNSANWFLGSVTDENGRELEISLDFLDKDKVYEATIYRNAEGSSFEENRTQLVIDQREVTSEDSHTLQLVPGGGYAVSFIVKKE